MKASERKMVREWEKKVDHLERAIGGAEEALEAINESDPNMRTLVDDAFLSALLGGLKVKKIHARARKALAELETCLNIVHAESMADVHKFNRLASANRIGSR